MTDNPTKLVAFQVSEAEADAIDRLAARSDRSRSAEIRVALRSWLESHDEHVDDVPDAPKQYAALAGA